MFFEGKCTATALIPTIITAMTTINPDDNLPYWENVSSNIGASKTDDGYVLHSNGSNGDNEIYIGFKPSNVYWHSRNRLDYGFVYFTGNKYKPNPVQGLNGTFEEYHDGSMPIIRAGSEPFLGFALENIPMKYMINVNKDRVIIAYWCEMKTSESLQNVIYLGTPPVLADPNRKITINIAHLNDPRTYNFWGSTHGRGRATNQNYSPNYGTDGKGNHLISVSNMFNSNRLSRGWGNTFYPSSINIWGYYYRSFLASLDIYIATQNNTYRNGDSIIINQVEYAIVEAEQTYETAGGNYPYHCGFTERQSNGQKVLYLIPKN
jgi:hypothetical protein